MWVGPGRIAAGQRRMPGRGAGSGRAGAGLAGRVEGLAVEGDGQRVVLGGGLGADLDQQPGAGGGLADVDGGVPGVGAGDRPAERGLDGGDLDVADPAPSAGRCGPGSARCPPAPRPRDPGRSAARGCRSARRCRCSRRVRGRAAAMTVASVMATSRRWEDGSSPPRRRGGERWGREVRGRRRGRGRAAPRDSISWAVSASSWIWAALVTACMTPPAVRSPPRMKWSRMSCCWASVNRSRADTVSTASCGSVTGCPAVRSISRTARST